MLYFFTGTDTESLREKLRAALAAKKEAVLRITDAHTAHDLSSALAGPGMFGEKRVVVLDHALQSEALVDVLLEELPRLRESEEDFFLLESDITTELRKRIEKYAEKTVRKDLPKKARDNSIFALANALERGQRKELWIGYQRELLKGNAPEAIHGVLFWAAKQAFLRSRSEKNGRLLAALAEVPHEARRRGGDLEYALERFVLSIA